MSNRKKIVFIPSGYWYLSLICEEDLEVGALEAPERLPFSTALMDCSSSLFSLSAKSSLALAEGLSKTWLESMWFDVCCCSVTSFWADSILVVVGSIEGCRSASVDGASEVAVGVASFSAVCLGFSLLTSEVSFTASFLFRCLDLPENKSNRKIIELIM